MALLYAPKRLYHTLDRKEVVEEGDPKAAFLLVGEGASMPEEEAKRLGLDKYMESADAQPTALDREREALANAEARGAFYEAESRRNTVARLEAGEVPAAPTDGTAPNIPAAGSLFVPTEAAEQADDESDESARSSRSTKAAAKSARKS